MNKVKLIGVGALTAIVVVVTAVAVNVNIPQPSTEASVTPTRDSNDNQNTSNEKDDTDSTANAEDNFTKPQGVSKTTPAKDDNKTRSHTPPSGHQRGTKTQAKKQPQTHSSTRLQSKAQSQKSSQKRSEETYSSSQSQTSANSQDSQANNQNNQQASQDDQSITDDEATQLQAAIAAALAVVTPQLVTTNTYQWQNSCPTAANSFSPIAGYPVCECTSYVAWKAFSTFGVTLSNFSNSNFWDSAALANGYVVDSTPTKDSIGQIKNDNGYGHLFWVEQVNSDGSITVTEYNNIYSTYLVSGEYRTRDFGSRIISASQAASFKYIHPDQHL